jgi:putative ABC transport system permease protein
VINKSQSHIEERLADFRKSGLTEEKSRRRIRLEFGGIEQVKEQYRDARRFNIVDRFIQDFRYAVRSLPKNPRFIVTAIWTLALGIGANTAIFILISDALLRPLPFFDPGRLVQLNQYDVRNGIGPFGYPDTRSAKRVLRVAHWRYKIRLLNNPGWGPL